ncbi:MAG TPA: acyltransferase [Rhizomicrobium sp.]|jgi:peptidoglycan/LPS O-acetylase OafA/YrhL|nr:acyltransferase [Rhizomicrobium sp.]
MAAETRKFGSLEGLRGILALLVCGGHLGLNTAANHFHVNVRFWLSVDVFFALSGFVLSYSNFYGRKSGERFAIGRFARLYPLHLATLLAMAILILWRDHAFDGTVFLQSLGLVQGIGLPPNRNGFDVPAWSISVEIWVSAIFFLVCRTKSWMVAAASAALTVALAVALPDMVNADRVNLFPVVNLGALRGLAGFAIGVAAYLVYERGPVLSPLLYRIGAWVSVIGLAVLFVIPGWSVATNLLLYAAMFAALICCAKADSAIPLSHPWMVYLGAISYAVYLLHMPVDEYLEKLFGNATHGAGKAFVFAVILVLAMAVHRYFEMPCQAWILQVTRKLRAPKAAAAEVSP